METLPTCPVCKTNHTTIPGQPCPTCARQLAYNVTDKGFWTPHKPITTFDTHNLSQSDKTSQIEANAQIL